MAATEKGLAVIRSFEGRALKAYRDAVGVVTIGYGNTNYDKFAVAYLGGPIKLGMTITDAQAEYLLRESLNNNYQPAVAKAMPGAKPNENDAGLSFHYNTGAIGRASWVKKWLAKADFHGSIVSWNKAGGNVLNGLTRRREREYAIITRGDYGPEGRTAPPVLNASGRVVPGEALKGTPGMLALGDIGPEVADLNSSLLLLGFKVAKGDAFMPSTEKAVRSFQTAHKQLTVDGIVGPATRAAINREADVKRKLTRTTQAVAGSEVTAATVDLATGGALPVSVYIALGVVAFCVAGFLAWKYRDELLAIGKR